MGLVLQKWRGLLGGYGICNLLFGIESLGTSLLWCTIVAGGAGGYIGGSGGGAIGVSMGASVVIKRHALK